MKARQALAAAMTATLLMPNVVLATDGYFPHGYGMKAKGRGGASTGVASGTLFGAVNPAQAVFAGGGFDLGVDLFSPKRQATREDNVYGLNGTTVSDKTLFPMPELGYNRVVSGRLAIGLSAYGNGGMNTTYPGGEIAANRCGMGAPASNLLCGQGTLGVNLEQMVIAPTVAFRIGGRQAIGVSPLIAWQRFKADGIQAFTMMSSAPAAVTNAGSDSVFGFGVRVGWMARISDQVSIGAAYSPKIRMGAFEKYKGLFAEEGDFDIPENMNAGIAITPTDRLLLAADVQRINYANVKSVGNPSTNRAPLGSEGGPGFGWGNVTVIRVGGDVKVSQALTVRAGYNHGTNPIQARDVTLNILAPGTITDHLTAGASIAVGETSSIDFAYMHAFESEVSGPAMMMPGGGTERISMYQNSFGVNFSKRWK